MTKKITEALVNNIQSKTKEYDIRDLELKGFLVRVNKSGNASYVLAYRNAAGKSRRITIAKVGEITAAKARTIALKYKLDIASGKDPNADKKLARDEAEKRKKSTFKAFFDNRYLKYVEAHHKEPRGTIKRLSKFVERWGELPLEDINLKLLHDYTTERLASGIANSTINRELNCVRGLFRLAEEESMINTNPFKKLKPLKIDKNLFVRYLTEQEEKRLINALNKRQQSNVDQRLNANNWRKHRNIEPMTDITKYKFSNYLMPLVLIALKTGLRRGELLSLKWSNVKFEDQNNHIHLEGRITKNLQSRNIPLNDSATAILNEWDSFCKDYHVKSDFVFSNPTTGEPMKEIGSAWNRVLEKADIKNFRFHDLRHTFASKLTIKGVDLNSIRELLGHSDISMTLRYAHLSPNHLRASVEGI